MAYKYVFGAAVFMSTIQSSLWAISHMFTVLARLVVGVMRGLKRSRWGCLSCLWVLLNSFFAVYSGKKMPPVCGFQRCNGSSWIGCVQC